MDPFSRFGALNLQIVCKKANALWFQICWKVGNTEVRGGGGNTHQDSRSITSKRQSSMTLGKRIEESLSIWTTPKRKLKLAKIKLIRIMSFWSCYVVQLVVVNATKGKRGEEKWSENDGSFQVEAGMTLFFVKLYLAVVTAADVCF